MTSVLNQVRRPRTGLFVMALLSVAVVLVWTALTSRSSAVGKGCAGCSYSSAAQNPVPEEAPEVLLVKEGQQITLRGSRALAPGDENNPRWSAAFGSVTPEGVYMAPATVPPDGIDTVSYINFDEDFSFAITIRVLPADDPGSVPAEARVWEHESSKPTSQPEPADDPAPDPSEPIENIFTDDETPPVEVLNITDIARQIINGEEVYAVPATATLSSDLDLIVYALSPTGLQKAQRGGGGGVLGAPSWINQGCELGPRANIGPTHTSSHSGRESSGSVTITAGMEVDLRAAGFNISAGSKHNIFKEVRRYRQWYNKDVYKCVNNRWKYAYTRQCSRTGVEYFGWDPGWAYVINGHLGGGTSWSSWSCTNI